MSIILTENDKITK